MKHIILSILFFLYLNNSCAIDYWQPYPINAVVTTNGIDFRIECSVYDSILGSWQYYNTPYIETAIVNLTSNNTGVITYNTYTSLPLNPYNRDSIYGFLIYDQELHIYKPVIGYFDNSSAKLGADIAAGYASVNFLKIKDNNGESYYNTTLIYDIYFHQWKEVRYEVIQGELWSIDPKPTVAEPKLGCFTVCDYYDTDEYQWDFSAFIYDPVIHEEKGIGGYDIIPATYETATIDLLINYGLIYIRYSCYDALQHSWPSYWHLTIDNSYFNSGIGYSSNSITGENRFAIYDDLLHQWAVDTVFKNISKLIIKDRVVAYADTISNPQQIFYQVFSPTLREWITDSSIVSSGLDSIYIQEGTVYWEDFNSTTNFSGYIDSIGWGNYSTPLLLNFNLTDLTNISGDPIIFVRNYSIGSDSIWYDFGDGIVTDDFKQQSLWHLFKSNGHYSYNAQNMIQNVCIKSNSSSGIQSSCVQYNQTFCSVAGNMNLSASSICIGDSVLLTVSGHNGSVQWQSRSNSPIWIDEISNGATTDSFYVSPSSFQIFRTKITNGLCAPAFTSPDSIFVSLQPVGGIISLGTDSICIGAFVDLSLTGSAGIIQWQSNYGFGWVNETGSGYYSPSHYLSQPNADVQFQVVATRGVCPAETSNVISIIVNSINDPVTINDTICGNGIINLNASGNGILNWYNSSTGGIPIFTGNNFSSSISSTTTWYVQSGSGINFNLGAVDNNIGAVNFYSGSSKYGLQFEVSELSTLDVLYVYPKTSGNLILTLADALTGNVLESKTFPLIANSGKTPLITNFNLSPGLTYNLYKDSYSPQLYYNSDGATYPMVTSGCPVSITGYLNPTFQTGNAYYYFYDWIISHGCKSNLVPATGVVTPFTSPAINASGPLSFCQGGNVVLSTNTGTGYSYQWYRNGLLLSGEINFYYTAYISGSYTVSVFDSTCGGQMLSIAAKVSVPCINPFDPQEKIFTEDTNPYMLFSYSNFNQTLFINAQNLKGTRFVLRLLDALGREIVSSKGSITKGKLYGEIKTEINCLSFASGYYTIHLQTDQENLAKKFIKE